MQLLLAKSVKCVNLTISPAKMSLFRMSREFRFGVCKHEKPHTSPQQKMEGKRKLGGLFSTESIVFLWLNYCQRTGHLSSSWVLLWLQDVRAPPSGLLTLINWCFCLLIFCDTKNVNLFEFLFSKQMQLSINSIVVYSFY